MVINIHAVVQDFAKQWVQEQGYKERRIIQTERSKASVLEFGNSITGYGRWLTSAELKDPDQLALWFWEV